MQVTRTHRFDHPFDEVWAMLLDPQAHLAKYRHMGHREVELVASDAGEGQGEDQLAITIVRLVDVEVPGIAAKFISPTNTVTSDDRWTLADDGTGTGRSDVQIKGVPVTSVGSARLVDDGDGGCTETIALDLTVKVPIVGDKVAKAMRPQLERQIDAEFAASEAWLAGER